jgi:hypothetical protein
MREKEILSTLFGEGDGGLESWRAAWAVVVILRAVATAVPKAMSLV